MPSGSYARQKGHKLERQVVNDGKAAGFTDAVTARMASKIADDCKIDVLNVGNLMIQCKSLGGRYASANVLETIDIQRYIKSVLGSDAEKRDFDKYIPAVVTKCNNKVPVIILPWEDFIKIYSKKK